MTRKEIEERKFRPASQEASDARMRTETPPTSSAAYRLAFQDTEFLLREDLRPVRFQLELLKPHLLLEIGSATCRERVYRYVHIKGDALYVKQKQRQKTT